MAIIPTYERTQFGPRGSDLPGPSSIDTQTAVQAGKNMQAGGQALLNVGQVLASIADKQMAAQDAIDRTKASTDADLQLNQLFTDTQQSELNGFVFEDKVKKGGLAIVNNIVSQYSGNVAKEIKSHLYQKYGQLQIQASAESHRKIVDNGEAVRVRETENSINNALRSTALGNPEAIPDAIAGNNAMIDDHLKAGIMNPKQADLEKIKYKEQITWSGFEQTLQNDPEGISKNIEEAIKVFDLTPEQAVTARSETGRQVKINEAAIKQQKQLVADEANKELTDHLLDGTLNINAINKNRDALTTTQYESWVKDYNSLVNHLKKTIDEDKEKQTEADLYVRAITGDEISTSKGMDTYTKEVADQVKLGILSPTKARQLLKDTETIDKGNPERKQAVNQSIDSIEVAYKNNMFGEGIAGTIEREKMIRDLRMWSIMNPDKDPVEFTEKVLTVKREHWIKKLFRVLPGVSIFVPARAPEGETPQEMRQTIMANPALPSKDEIGTIIKENKFKNKSEVIQYIQSNYGMNQQEALSFYDGLK